MTNILIAAAVLALLGLVLGILIGYTAKRFAVEADPRIEEITELLPGANCGGCGYAGCADFAKEIVENDANISSCSACSEENFKKIAEILGKEAGNREKQVAVVYCSGDNHKAKRLARYNGLNDCRAAAALSGGGKTCRFGCIGLGSCARRCQFGAIEIRNGLAIVHPELCEGCGNCIDICPRKLIRLVPATSKIHVYCNSLEKGPVKRKACEAACIACKKCVRAVPDSFNAQGFLVRVTEDSNLTEETIREIACPTGALDTVAHHTAANSGKEGAA
ncbi:MAG: RnfABCDGE type electron transport complex subunit B [Lentisphaeria bacterium]|nr:RnfABCDGE type electron transport complex subunit B [Lentisphaeria bacterium]